MLGTHFNPRKIIMLEFSQYLECYLWPNYTEKASTAHVLSIVVMLNEKFRERIDAWQCFVNKPEHFASFIHRVLELSLDENDRSNAEQCAIVTFLVNSFNSVEVDIVREQMNKLTHMSIWMNVLPSQRDDLIAGSKKLRKYWAKLSQKIAAEDAEDSKESRLAKFQRNYLWNLIARFKRTLDRVDDDSKEVDIEDIRYCERFIELVIDLEALLPTRRFFNALVHSSKLITHCVLSKLISSEAGSLFCQLVEMLKFYARFEINDITGQQLTHKEVSDKHYEHVVKLQKAAFKYFRDSMPDFYLLSVGSVDTRKALLKQFNSMKKSDIYRFAEYLHLVPPADSENSQLETLSKEFLTETVTLHCERRVNQLQQLNEQPLYPTEKVIWDENVVPYENYSGEGVLALNKLNLQFLTLHDYLLRNFNLFQLESTYEIRQDLEDVLFRMKPWQHETRNETVWGGWARMALLLDSFQIVEVTFWCLGLRKHDVCFLVTCRSTQPVGTKYDVRKPFKDQIQVTYVRGCEIEGMMDQNGQVIEEFEAYEKKPQIQGDIRKYRVFLDPNQYRIDMENRLEKGAEDIYYTFNLVVRRDPKTNNFKAVLATMRQLLNTEMNNAVLSMDFNDTFLSFDHLIESFPGYQIKAMAEGEKMVPPFLLQFNDLIRDGENEGEKVIEVTPLVRNSRTPYPFLPKKNQVRFTPAQVEAIKAGMEPGLTMVVGPPGTGKTDVAVQIIANIYHNWPQQRTLIVTHSNQALNQLFEKIIALDVDERHLLRMGHGEEGLETEKDFSRYGRVNHVLRERLRLLSEVCRAWDEFIEKCAVEKNGLVAEVFPFTGYFSDINPLFSGLHASDMEVAHSCWRHISHIFEQLEEFRAFELLRNGRDRTEYLLVKEAKIIAMTCTHAALRRSELVELGFRYDNILMEEAAQILEVETFIPLLLQNPQDGRNRLKRWCMIGDHHQLPPVVQNQAFQKYSNMEQSLFARFVRLGVPNVQLDKQGRARAEIAALYSWRYRNLGNLPHVEALPQFQNLGEAEYAVALFTYMRIIGYPAEKISIITTYNGQAQLIRDVVERRCANNPLIGSPAKVSTVDKYQGQQNDYIILSLVRTYNIGHIRDVRRLVVALSRARLGLYVLCRASLFRNCFELTPAFNILCKRPPHLLIIPSEAFPTQRKCGERSDGERISIENTIHMSTFVHDFYMSNMESMRASYEQTMERYRHEIQVRCIDIFLTYISTE
uniref:Intron-binding protein aquarius n=1 Tax=Angiostrongylus cantonensis TaxID=6313 RepID=A0A0K0D9B0_ANGCA